jgi:trk system potassium uptake protein
MKIVIVGSGNVGFHLADLLVKEGHDIIIIDNHAKTLKKLTEVLDVMGVYGDGSFYDVQVEAGVQNSDLLIAVTPRDEINMLCCLLAKKIGAKQTIARVRNPEYSDQLFILKDELGLTMSINPELAAAREIDRILKFPSALKVDTLAKGVAELVQFKLSADNPLTQNSLNAISSKYFNNVLISAVERNNEVYMPNGDFVLQENDKVHIIGKPKDIGSFFKAINHFLPQSKYVMIAGGGHITYHLASLIIAMGMKLKIIEKSSARCEELCELLPKADIVCGDETDQELLVEEKLKNVDTFIALTNSDEANLIISMYAKYQNVPKVITKINRTNYIDVMQNLGIDCIISQQIITSNVIARYVRSVQNSVGNSVLTLYKIVNDKAEAIEFIARKTTKYLKVPLYKLNLKDNLLIAALVRDDKLIIPDGNDIIQIDDNVIVVTTNKQLNDLNDIYQA